LLRDRAEAIRLAELARASAQLRSFSEPDRQEVATLTAEIVERFLERPTALLEDASQPDHAFYASVLAHLFALRDGPERPGERDPELRGGIS